MFFCRFSFCTHNDNKKGIENDQIRQMVQSIRVTIKFCVIQLIITLLTMTLID